MGSHRNSESTDSLVFFLDLILVRFMRARDLALFLLLAAVAAGGGSEPDRAKGLSVHMLPDRVAQIDGHRGGFTARDASGNESVYADSKELVAFFHTLPLTTQQNGIWIVTTHPSAYSSAEHDKLWVLLELCRLKTIPVFTCRGSELPGGWKRSDVPTGWNNPSETH